MSIIMHLHTAASTRGYYVQLTSSWIRSMVPMEGTKALQQYIPLTTKQPVETDYTIHSWRVVIKERRLDGSLGSPQVFMLR